jgi:hypothetical protein
MNMAAEEGEIEIEPDPRENPYELPPIEGQPFADDDERRRAVLEVVEQAERERAAASMLPDA